MRKIRHRAIALVGAFALWAAPAGAETLRAVCGEPSNKDIRYIIDATTGEAARYDAESIKNNASTGRYNTYDLVRVYVKNTNPFRYAYTLGTKDSVVAEPNGTDLLAHIALLPAPATKPAPEASSGAGTGGSGGSARINSVEEGSPAPFEELLSAGNRIEAARAEADDAVSTSERHIRTVGETVTEKQAVLAQPMARCQDLLDAARALVEAVDVDPHLDVAAKLIEKYRREQQLGMPAGVSDEYPALTKRLDAARETHAKLTKIASGVKTIANSTAFFKSVYIGDYDAPTDVVITLARKELADEKAAVEELHKRTLNFGGRGRFSTSAGWSFSWLRRRTFERIQGHPSPSPGEAGDLSQLVPVVGLSENSPERNGPMAMINVRLKTLGRHASLHASFGATPKSEDSSLSVEYLIGPSLALAEDRFFITLGLYVGRQEKLADGLFVGEAVPEALATVPVTRDLKTHLGFALTYRLK